MTSSASLEHHWGRGERKGGEIKFGEDSDYQCVLLIGKGVQRNG